MLERLIKPITTRPLVIRHPPMPQFIQILVDDAA